MPVHPPHAPLCRANGPRAVAERPRARARTFAGILFQLSMPPGATLGVWGELAPQVPDPGLLMGLCCVQVLEYHRV